ncbi:MAG: hypothetical protein V3V15_06350 [Sphingorhabdus sp.]
MTNFEKILSFGVTAALAASPAIPAAGAHAAYDGRLPEFSKLAMAPPRAKPPRLQRAAPTQIQMPPPQALIVMIRSSVVALGHANTTNNYSVLKDLGSANFRKNNSPQRLSQLFAPFRSNKIDLAPVVFLTPQLTQQPRIENGRLKLVGYFPSRPMQVNFDLMFEPSDGVWKLFGLSVNLNRVQPRPAAQQQFVPGQGGQPQSR